MFYIYLALSKNNLFVHFIQLRFNKLASFQIVSAINFLRCCTSINMGFNKMQKTKFQILERFKEKFRFRVQKGIDQI